MSAFTPTIQKIGSLLGINSKGQATKANSLPVAIASDQDLAVKPSALSQTGTITANGGSVVLTGVDGYPLLVVAINGTYAGVNLTIEGLFDGTNWVTLQGTQIDSTGSISATGALTNITRAYVFLIRGATQVRARATAWTSGTQNVVLRAVAGASEPLANIINNVTVQGNVTHGAATASNILTTGVEGRSTNRTKVSDSQMERAVADLGGRLVTTLVQARELVTQTLVTVSATTETNIVAAGGSNVFNDLLHLTLSNTGTTGCRVDIRDSSGGTVRHSVFLNGMSTLDFSFPIPLTQTTANNIWTAQISAVPTSGDVRVFMQTAKFL